MNKRKAYDVVGLWVLDPRDRDAGGTGDKGSLTWQANGGFVLSLCQNCPTVTHQVSAGQI